MTEKKSKKTPSIRVGQKYYRRVKFDIWAYTVLEINYLKPKQILLLNRQTKTQMYVTVNYLTSNYTTSKLSILMAIFADVDNYREQLMIEIHERQLKEILKKYKGYPYEDTSNEDFT